MSETHMDSNDGEPILDPFVAVLASSLESFNIMGVDLHGEVTPIEDGFTIDVEAPSGYIAFENIYNLDDCIDRFIFNLFTSHFHLTGIKYMDHISRESTERISANIFGEDGELMGYTSIKYSYRINSSNPEPKKIQSIGEQ